jgi:hypothetical protein
VAVALNAQVRLYDTGHYVEAEEDSVVGVWIVNARADLPDALREIERLAADNARLRAALTDFADAEFWEWSQEYDSRTMPRIKERYTWTGDGKPWQIAGHALAGADNG